MQIGKQKDLLEVYDNSILRRYSMNKNSEKVIRYRIRLKQRLIEYKGGKCSRCGYNKDCPPAYDFHHRNPKEKDFQISGSCIGLEKMKKEVDKCDLVCRNCHAEIHDENWSSSRKEILNRKRVSVKNTTKTCPKCCITYNPKRKEQKYCSKTCRDKACKKHEIYGMVAPIVERPLE